MTAEALRNVAGVEIDTSTGLKALVSGQAPPWLLTLDQRPIFERALAEGDLLGAWMSLNSPGWTYGEVREPLRRLAEAAGDPAFTLLAETWSAQPHASGFRERDADRQPYVYPREYWDAL
jgi:hypothetical protein